MSQHRSPCRECPWRKASAPGWLGGDYSPEEWLELARSDEPVQCHLALKKQCAGSSIYRANTGKRSRDKAVLVLPKDKEEVFSSPMDFVKHHRSRGIVSSEL